MKRLLILPALLLLGACATTETAVTTDLTNDILAPTQATFGNVTTTSQTPLQALSAALGNLANNKLLTAVNQDAADTLVWVDSAQGPTDPLMKFQAQACPTAIQLATGSIQQTVAQMQSLISQLDTQQQNIASGGNPELILQLTKLRYGPVGTPGSDPSAMLANLKTVLWAQISAVVDSCRQIVPAKQIAGILQQAAAAGLTGGGSTVIGVLP